MVSDELEHYYEIYTYAMRLGMEVPPMEKWDSEPCDMLKNAWSERSSCLPLDNAAERR